MPSGFGRGQGRDWGGRHKVNPPNAPRVTRQDVIDFALSLNVEVKRLGQGMWMKKVGEEWYTCGQTNYLALRNLRKCPTCGGNGIETATKKYVRYCIDCDGWGLRKSLIY